MKWTGFLDEVWTEDSEGRMRALRCLIIRTVDLIIGTVFVPTLVPWTGIITLYLLVVTLNNKILLKMGLAPP